MTTTSKRVLFLCTGNSARSQMAEAFLNLYAGKRYEAHSAGLEPKGINPYTIQVMLEKNIDLSEKRSKPIKEYLGRSYIHTLITVCDYAEENCPRIWPGITERLHWSFEDPAAFTGSHEETLEKFREIRNQIEQKITSWLNSQPDN
ncbi:MAG: low molecular weight phosphatase family protein [Chloroflexi bacterium HGW-Chloroflexi-10]|nr:MAG: low molecular weight phosphatase family protein [Chloroflexi bacterium HGW-Chloroflexi-10]